MFFDDLERINVRPAVFSVDTTVELWTDPHVAERMLAFHLDPDVALASRTSEFVRRSLRWLVTHFGLGPGASVLDLGCGPGLYANPLARLGLEVVGVDVSERSLRHARSTATAGAAPTYVHGNYLDVEVPGRFDLVLLAMCDYCALGPVQRRSLLGRVRSWLAPEGRFVFDVVGIRSLRERAEGVVYEPGLMDGFWSAEPYHGFLRTFVYEDELVTLDRYEIVERNRSRSIYNWLQHFDTGSLTAELAAEGLVVDEVHGDLTGAPLDDDPAELCAVASRR